MGSGRNERAPGNRRGDGPPGRRESDAVSVAVGVVLDQSALGKAHQRASGNDKVVKHPHIDERQRLLQALGQKLVGPAGLGHPRRVVVGENDGSGVVGQRLLHHLPRVDRGLGQRAAEELLQAMTRCWLSR